MDPCHDFAPLDPPVDCIFGDQHLLGKPRQVEYFLVLLRCNRNLSIKVI
jgi:hypothetical protein